MPPVSSSHAVSKTRPVRESFSCWDPLRIRCGEPARRAGRHQTVPRAISPMVISSSWLSVFFAQHAGACPPLTWALRRYRADVRRAPHDHLGAARGLSWAVANKLTIFAIATSAWHPPFPCGTPNSLLGIPLGFSFIQELRQAGWDAVAPVVWAARWYVCRRKTTRAVASSERPRRAFSQRGLGCLGPEFFGAPCTFPYQSLPDG